MLWLNLNDARLIWLGIRQGLIYVAIPGWKARRFVTNLELYLDEDLVNSISKSFPLPTLSVIEKSHSEIMHSKPFPMFTLTRVDCYNSNLAGIPKSRARQFKCSRPTITILCRPYLVLQRHINHALRDMISDLHVAISNCLSSIHRLTLRNDLQSAGCDNVLGSTLEFDRCGICGGNGSSCSQVRNHEVPKFQWKETGYTPCSANCGLGNTNKR